MNNKKYLIQIQFLIFSFLTCNILVAQDTSEIKFSYRYLNKRDSSHDIKLTVENQSKKTIYYSIALQGYTNSGWKPLLSDINSLGTNDFLVLKLLKPKAKEIKIVSKKKINNRYKHYNINKIRFGIMFYEKQDLKSKGQIKYLDPLSL